MPISAHDRTNQMVRHAFISYVREDEHHVDRLQRKLESAGVRVWRDIADLWPGEDWRAKIRQAITDDALVFIACFSRQSIARNQSYQNEELILAIEQLRRRRAGDPWLIPVRFSDCDIPDVDIGMGRTLRSLQRVDLFGDRADEGAARLVVSVLRLLGHTADIGAAMPSNPGTSDRASSQVQEAARILLVADQPPDESHFRRLFDPVDVCRNYDDLVQAISNGSTWSAAFVDFDLSGDAEKPQRTGLSILKLLLEKQPKTRRIAYTKLNDNGGTLYAAAAWHWLDTRIVVDKSSSEQMLIAATLPDRPNPTLPVWKEKLKSAYLIDHLFARSNWLPLWQMWRFRNGSMSAMRDHLPFGISPLSLRQFSLEASDAVDRFRDAFEVQRIRYVRRNSPRATPLVAFSDANSKFFNAPDLQEILDFAEPWGRIGVRSRPTTR